MLKVLKVNRPINWLIVHVLYTKESMNVGPEWLQRVHESKGIIPPGGYNYLVKFDGSIYDIRSLDRYGAHTRAKRANARSIGVALEGGMSESGGPKDTLRPEQWQTVLRLFREAQEVYPSIKIAGHNQFDKKACPCFDVREYASKHGLKESEIYQREPLIDLSKF